MKLVRNFSTFEPLWRTCSVIGLCVFIYGCGDLFRPTIANICETNPELCQGFNEDGWCRAEKADIIRHKFDHLNMNGDAHLYPLLEYWEAYETCIEKATHIRHIKYRDKETQRMQGYLLAQQEQKKLSRQTRESDDPNLQYYHWSRNGDEEALKRFMRQAKSGKFSTPALWMKVASVHLKRDNPEARKALYKALAYYDDTEEVPTQIFESLITSNLDDERYASAYVWAHVYADVNEEGETALAQTKPLVMKPVNMQQLTGIADKVSDAIDDGVFDAKKLGLWRLK